MTYDIIIAGLGAMGSATAYHLAGRGARVLGLDRYHPPHILGSTHGGSRVIRETAFEHPQYVPLARLAYRQWRLMEQALGEPLLHVTGGLYLGAAGSQVVAGTRTSALAHGVSHEDLDAAEVARRFPLFANLDGASGLFEPGAGWLAPERIVAACLRYAGDHGVELRFDEPVLRWQSHADGVVVETGQGRYRAGQLLLAAGPWLPQLLGPLGWGLSVERVTQHWFTPSHDAASFDRLPIFIWETPHEVFYGFPRIDGAVKVAVHHGGERTTPETVRREVSAGEIEATRTILRRHLPALDGAHQRSAVCLYTNSVDGHFVIDHHPALQRVLIASPCSGFGFKFAAAIGAMLADLLTQRAPEIDLATFRLRW